MENLSKLAGKPGEVFNQGESMSGGNTITDPPYGSAPGSMPVNPPPSVGLPHDDPTMEIPAEKDLTHKVSASHSAPHSTATWKKAGE